MEVQVIYHYSQDDKDCSEAYCGVELIIDGKVVALFDDYYHDKGSEKVAGFIMALHWMQLNNLLPSKLIESKTKHLPDWETWMGWEEIDGMVIWGGG